MKTKYNNLLIRYLKAIKFLYDKIDSGDYTADCMRYDYEGYCLAPWGDLEERDMEDLKQAVQKAELLVKYYKHNYKHYKYC
jgi:hypothetical protein